MKCAVAGCDEYLGSVFYLDSNCLLHQYHILVREQLQLIDVFLQEAAAGATAQGEDIQKHLFQKYYASIAKTVNFWREHVHQLITSWENIHGPKAPDGVNYRAYPLRVVSGRWGSVENAEEFMLKRTRTYLGPALLGVLSSKVKAAGSGEGGEPPVDNAARGRGRGRGRGRRKVTKAVVPSKPTAEELVDDESGRAAYQFKMSKWAAGCFAAVASSLFWLLLRIASTVRSPLTHFYCWCMKHSQDRLIFRLVCGKAEEFKSEFDHLLNTLSAWFETAVIEALATDLPTTLLKMVQDLAQELLVTSAASYHLRVVDSTLRRVRCWEITI